jgi:4-hydroxy-tetrahydrodipicolinate synthase
LLVGPEELLAEAVLFGGHGSMAAGSNVWPGLFVELYNAAQKRDLKRLTALHRRVIEFGNVIYRVRPDTESPIKGIKCGLSALGVCGDTMAEPFAPYSGEEREWIRQGLEAMDLVAQTPIQHNASDAPQS